MTMLHVSLRPYHFRNPPSHFSYCTIPSLFPPSLPPQVEVGGIKGRAVTMGVKQVHEDFLGAVQRVRSVPYDIMDVGATQFEVRREGG